MKKKVYWQNIESRKKKYVFLTKSSTKEKTEPTQTNSQTESFAENKTISKTALKQKDFSKSNTNVSKSSPTPNIQKP